MKLGICPYCSKEMKRGSIPNGDVRPYWLPEEELGLSLRFLVPKGGIKLVLGDMGWQFNATAYYCPDCKIVIAETEK